MSDALRRDDHHDVRLLRSGLPAGGPPRRRADRVDQPRDGRPRQQGPHLRQGPLRAPVRALARPPHRAARARERRLPDRLLGGGDRRITEAFTRIKAEHGPDAIAGLASSRATNEDCYVMQRLMRAAIGTHNIDNCSRVCHSPTSFALRKSFGLSGATGSFDDIEAAEVALLIGVNPTQGHPVVGARIKQAAIKGLKLVTADPRRIELADYGAAPPRHPAGHQRGAPERAGARGDPRRPRGPRVRRRAHRGLRGGRRAGRGLHARERRGDHRRAGGRHRARGAPLRGRRARLHPLGPRRDRAPLRLGVRPADLQPRAADRQRRPAGRGAAAAARPEQRAGLVRPRRAAGHLHRLPARSRTTRSPRRSSGAGASR